MLACGTSLRTICRTLLPSAQLQFARFQDLLLGYAVAEHSYEAFAGRVRRRLRGEPEEFEPRDESEEEEDHEDYEEES